MDYQVKRDDGKLISYKLVGHNVLPVEGRCSEDSTLLHDGIVVVPDSSAAQKVPAVDGLLEFRKDKQELLVRANKTWNVLAPENKILQKTMDGIKKLKESSTNEKKIILHETDKKYKLNLDKINKLDEKLENLMKKLYSPTTKKEMTTTPIIPTTVLPQRKECFGYKWLRESNRNQKYSQRELNCDSGLSTGWYRFGGGAGIKIPTTCVSKYRCGTSATGWMNGAHPTVADGKVTRKVCYSWGGNCCNWSNNIEVVNCGQYYVYKLSAPSAGCNLRYCGSDN